MRPAIFRTTARPNRRRSLSQSVTRRVTRTVENQLTRAGLGAIRAVAGPVAADVVSALTEQVKRVRRGGSAGLLTALVGELGGVGRALAWILSGSRGSPAAAPQDVRAAREIVARVRDELPSGLPPSPIPPPVQPFPGQSPESRGAPGGTGGSGGRFGGDGGRRSPPAGSEGDGGDGGGDGGGGSGQRPGKQSVAMIRVTNSSNVHSYGYNAETATLYVRYLGQHLDRNKVKVKRNEQGGIQHIHVGKGASGGRSAKPGPLYAYDGVPGRVFAMMQRAISKGTFVWDALRVRGSRWRHRYGYRLVAAGVANIGRDPSGRADTILYVPRKATKKGFAPRHITVASGQTIQSNRTGRVTRRAQMAVLRQIGF